MIRRDFGSAVANDLARRTVVRPHRDGGQVQFIPRPVPDPQLASTARARAWALQRLARPLTLRQLAGQESMRVRTFTRRFREEVGMAPLHLLTQQRLHLARQLLEETDHPTDRVAARGLRHRRLAAATPARRSRGLAQRLPEHLPLSGRLRRRRGRLGRASDFVMSKGAAGSVSG